LQIDASLANAEVAAVASPFGDLTGNGVADAVLMVNMVNLLPVNGYQFDFSLNPGIVDVITAIDGNYLMSGGQGGLVAQMSATGSGGTVIGFDATFSGATLPQSLTGQLLAVLVLSPEYTGVGAEVAATITNFVISGSYNGENVGLGACDDDLDPFNGCVSTAVFGTPTADCAGIPAGNHFVDSCDDCVLESSDFDGDGLADQCDETPWGDVELSVSVTGEDSADINYSSNADIFGYQFDVSGVTLTGASGDFDAVSFSGSTGMVLGFDFGGVSLPAGEGLLASVTFTPSVDGATISVGDVVVTGAAGNALGVTGPADADVAACANNDSDDLCNVADDCPEDADNDADGDGICGGIDGG
jgi:hypothetical protein